MDDKNRRIVNFKKWTLLSTSIILIGLGIFFTAKNALFFINSKQLVEASMDEKNAKLKEEPIQLNSKEGNQTLYPIQPKMGENIGELVIPKLKTSLPIIHGTNEDELEKGVGHFAGSVLPGEDDNSVLAGHRDTVFRRLGEIGVNDRLIVKTSTGTFTYKVRKVRIVDRDDRTVIVSTPRATLTVSTCYPFSFIGPAPKRYVLVADLISKK